MSAGRGFKVLAEGFLALRRGDGNGKPVGFYGELNWLPDTPLICALRYEQQTETTRVENGDARMAFAVRYALNRYIQTGIEAGMESTISQGAFTDWKPGLHMRMALAVE